MAGAARLEQAGVPEGDGAPGGEAMERSWRPRRRTVRNWEGREDAADPGKMPERLY